MNLQKRIQKRDAALNAVDYGARRYVINRKDTAKATAALHEAGFLVCVHPSLWL